MLTLTIRTDKPEAELGLFRDGKKLTYETWQAHRELAETIHLKIKDILADNNYDLKRLEGLVVFRGPGSFTGLRIGITVANALADSLQLPIVGEMGDDWIERGMEGLLRGEKEPFIVPEYGALPNITAPKK